MVAYQWYEFTASFAGYNEWAWINDKPSAEIINAVGVCQILLLKFFTASRVRAPNCEDAWVIGYSFTSSLNGQVCEPVFLHPGEWHPASLGYEAVCDPRSVLRYTEEEVSAHTWIQLRFFGLASILSDTHPKYKWFWRWRDDSDDDDDTKFVLSWICLEWLVDKQRESCSKITCVGVWIKCPCVGPATRNGIWSMQLGTVVSPQVVTRALQCFAVSCSDLHRDGDRA